MDNRYTNDKWRITKKGPETFEFSDSMVSNKITQMKINNLDHYERCDSTGERQH